MRLLVDCIPYDGGRSGISVYVRGVVGELRAQGHELTLLLEPDAEVPEGKGLPAVRAPRWTRKPALSMLWHLLALPWRIRRMRGAFDGFVLCAANRRVCAFYPLPTVATVHDLANCRIPGKYSRSRMFYLKWIMPRFAKKAHRLVAVSGATKADMVRFWGCRAEDVAAIHVGTGAKRPPAGTGTRGSNILYISRLEHPGKNHVRLIEAYGRLPRALAEAHPLVLAGADWKDAETVKAAAAASPHADLVRFAGFVPEEDMERLWAETGFYVFPSLCEGFGSSLAEAMARGVPCACSGNGALAEVGGDAAVTFDPEDAGDIARGLLELLGEGEDARKARVERGKARAATFSYDAHARGLVALFGGAE
jgi:glycosyltransferase involved in cell wall biosynthesis